MTTHLTDDQLQDVLDGVLDTAERDAFGVHLTACGDCASRLARFRALAAGVQALPRSIDPPRDLYPAIAARIAERRVVAIATWRRRWWLAAAAVLLVTASSGVTMLVLRQRAPLVATVSLPAEVMVLEANYVGAVDDLERQLAAERPRLAPATVAVVERNLAVIDRAIRESREALARDPANQDLARLLWTTYQHKLDLLQRATRLTAS